MRQDTREPFSEVGGAAHSARFSPRSLRQRAAWHPEAHQGRQVPKTYYVRYEDATERLYLVRTLDDDRLIRVSKRYALSEPSDSARVQPPRSARLLRWSTYALMGVGLGGLGGMLLGVLVVLVAGMHLVGFSLRLRRWRREQQEASGNPTLPTVASAERLRLLGALGQGLLAVALGSLVLALLLWHVLF